MLQEHIRVNYASPRYLGDFPRYLGVNDKIEEGGVIEYNRLRGKREQNYSCQSGTFVAVNFGIKNCSKVTFLRVRIVRKCVGTSLKPQEWAMAQIF